MRVDWLYFNHTVDRRSAAQRPPPARPQAVCERVPVRQRGHVAPVVAHAPNKQRNKKGRENVALDLEKGLRPYELGMVRAPAGALGRATRGHFGLAARRRHGFRRASFFEHCHGAPAATAAVRVDFCGGLCGGGL